MATRVIQYSTLTDIRCNIHNFITSNVLLWIKNSTLFNYENFEIPF